MAEQREFGTAEFDYVIAGGGTAGCVLAARLSEDPPGVTVCLIEAGPSDVGDDAILDLSAWMHLLDSGYDWDYPVEPQERGNSFMRHARAKVLGGCSSHNSCIAFWPPAEALDEWVRMGAVGWGGAADVLPLVERLTQTVLLRDVPPEDPPCGAAVLEAAAMVGLPTVAFNRGETVRNGGGVVPDQRGGGKRTASPGCRRHMRFCTRSWGLARTWRFAPMRGSRRSSSTTRCGPPGFVTSGPT